MTAPASESWPCANADAGCPNPARGRRHKYCNTCHSRRVRQSSRRRPRYSSAYERLWAAAEAVADAAAGENETYRAAVKRRSKALRALVREEMQRLRAQDDIAALLARMEAPGSVADAPAGPDTAERGREQRPICEEAATPGPGKALPEG